MSGGYTFVSTEVDISSTNSMTFLLFASKPCRCFIMFCYITTISQPPTLPCDRTSSMQSIVRPRKITRNQPPANDPRNHIQATRADDGRSGPGNAKGGRQRDFGASAENGPSNFTSSQTLREETSEKRITRVG